MKKVKMKKMIHVMRKLDHMMVMMMMLVIMVMMMIEDLCRSFFFLASVSLHSYPFTYSLILSSSSTSSSSLSHVSVYIIVHVYMLPTSCISIDVYFMQAVPCTRVCIGRRRLVPADRRVRIPVSLSLALFPFLVLSFSLHIGTPVRIFVRRLE